jgi:hypothetical protein
MKRGLFRSANAAPPPFGEIRWKEWIFPFLFTAVLIALVWIPYHDAYRQEGAGHKFMGLVGETAIDDNNVYLGLMRQAAEGTSLFTNNFTPESNSPALFNFLYLSLGRLAGWTGWSLDSVHRGFGAVSILLLVLTAYSFIATAIRRPFYRRFALVLACFGGGFLWLDRILLKPIGFEAVAFLPIAAVYLLLDALGQGRVPGINRLKCTAIVLAMPLGMLMINRWMLMQEPFWGDVVARLDFHTPEPFRLIFGLGASFFIVVLTSDGFLGMGRPSGERMAKAWVLTVLFLAYVPYINWRWHLLNGIQIPLSILAIQGLRRTLFRRILLRRRARRQRRCLPRGLWAPPALAAVMTMVLLACCLSAGNLFLSYRHEATRVREPAFLTTAEVSAMSWMDRAVSRDALVFASGAMGNYVPRMSGQRVFLGEDKLTNAFEARERNVQEFFSEQWDDAKRMALLKQFRVDYVFYGPDEKKLGPYDPSQAAFLTRVYDQDGIQIYQVRSEKPTAMRASGPHAGGAMP